MSLRKEAKRARDLVYESLFRRRLYTPQVQREVVDEFHRLYYDSQVFRGTWRATSWLGTPVLKCPFDLWVYQELLHEVRPDVIVECGTAEGGSALFFASIFDLLGAGRVVTIDVERQADRPEHERIRYLTGSSTSDDTLADVRKSLSPDDRVMVFLDSDHSRDHVLAELCAYSPLVTVGSYLVVEDSNVNGHPVEPDFGPGPMEAVEDFLVENGDQFEVDRRCEKFYLTFNPSGYLRRVQ